MAPVPVAVLLVPMATELVSVASTSEPKATDESPFAMALVPIAAEILARASVPAPNASDS